MADTKITLEFEATGADQAVAEVKKVTAAEEDLSLQEQRKQRLSSGGNFGMATLPPEEAAAAEREARQAAARLANEKAVAEAQAIRVGLAQKAAREQAASDLEAVIAAREKLALEEKNTATVLSRILARAAVPRSREATAVLRLTNNSAALGMLGNVAKAFVTGPWAMLVAGMAAGGVAIEMASKQFDRLKEAIPTAELGAVAEAIVHPWETAKTMIGAAAVGIGSVLDKAFLGGSYARMKQNVDEAISAQKNAEATKKKYEDMVVTYAKMEASALAVLAATQAQETRFMTQALEDAGKLMKIQGELDASREKRAGVGDGTSAISAVQRVVAQDNNAEEIARLTVATADKNLSDLIARKYAADSGRASWNAQLDAELVKAQTDVDIAGRKLSTLIKEHDIQLTQSAEEAIDTVATESGGKVTAMVKDAIGVIQQVADNNGGELKGTAKGAMDKLTAILADSIPDEQQVDAINQAMKAFRGSQDAANAGVVGNFDAMINNTNGMLVEVFKHRSEINSMKSAIEQLSIRRR